MNLYIKQKVFSIGDQFFIYDESGGEKYHVDEQIFSIRKTLRLYNWNNEQVALIERKIWSLHAKHFIYLNEGDPYEIIKEFTFFKPEYTVLNNGWKIKGDFLNHDYEIINGDTVVGYICKRWMTWGDSYEISIADDVDEILVLSIVLIIDAILECQKSD